MTDAAPAETPGKQTGAAEVHEDETERLARIDRELTEAAAKGWDALKQRWDKVSDDDAPIFNEAMKVRHKPNAREVDRVRA